MADIPRFPGLVKFYCIAANTELRGRIRMINWDKSIDVEPDPNYRTLLPTPSAASHYPRSPGTGPWPALTRIHMENEPNQPGSNAPPGEGVCAPPPEGGFPSAVDINQNPHQDVEGRPVIEPDLPGQHIQAVGFWAIDTTVHLEGEVGNLRVFPSPRGGFEGTWGLPGDLHISPEIQAVKTELHPYDSAGVRAVPPLQKGESEIQTLTVAAPMFSEVFRRRSLANLISIGAYSEAPIVEGSFTNVVSADWFIEAPPRPDGDVELAFKPPKALVTPSPPNLLLAHDTQLRTWGPTGPSSFQRQGILPSRPTPAGLPPSLGLLVHVAVRGDDWQNPSVFQATYEVFWKKRSGLSATITFTAPATGLGSQYRSAYALVDWQGLLGAHKQTILLYGQDGTLWRSIVQPFVSNSTVGVQTRERLPIDEMRAAMPGLWTVTVLLDGNPNPIASATYAVGDLPPDTSAVSLVSAVSFDVPTKVPKKGLWTPVPPQALSPSLDFPVVESGVTIAVASELGADMLFSSERTRDRRPPSETVFALSTPFIYISVRWPEPSGPRQHTIRLYGPGASLPWPVLSQDGAREGLPDGSWQTWAVLAVAGTPIEWNGMTGEWTAQVLLDDGSVPIAPARFTLE